MLHNKSRIQEKKNHPGCPNSEHYLEANYGCIRSPTLASPEAKGNARNV